MGIKPERGPAPHRRRVDPWLLPAALLSLIPVILLLRPGIAGTADGFSHILRTLEVTELFKSGAFFPRWAPNFYFGYGYPFFLFYTPGVHMVTAVFASAGLGVSYALVATQTLALLLYGTGAYLAAKRLFVGLASERVVAMAALASAALYVFTPLRMRELFTQGNLSQLAALSLLPWALWALLPAAERGSLRWAAVAGLVMAALLYAHHPTAFLSFPILFALGAGAILLRAERRRPAAVALVAAFALALALNAPFWLPWLVESSYGSLESMETGFNPTISLIPLDELFSPALPLDRSSLNSPQPIALGLAPWVFATLGGLAAAVLVRRARDARTRRRAALLFVPLALLAACVILMLPLSAFLWLNVPIAKFIAFPWRLLGPAGLLAALMGGALLLPFAERYAFPALLGALLAAPLAVAPYLFPAPGLWAPVPLGGVTLADIGRYEAGGGSRATASANEYLPRWVENPDPPLDLLAAYEAGDLPERLDITTLPPGARFETLRSAPLETVHRLALPSDATVTISRFYYPGWRASIDGQPVDIRPSSPYGLILVDVPAGNHELRVAWGTTPPRQLGAALFLLGIGGAALLLVRDDRRGGAVARFAGGDGSVAKAGAPLWLGAAGFIALLALVKAMWIEPHTMWFRLASPPGAPVMMTNPLHLRYDNGLELLGYDLPSDEVRQGGELRLRLYWRSNRPLAGDFRSYAHLDAPEGGAMWVNLTKDNVGWLPTSLWATGPYVVDEFRLRVPADTPPVIANLRVGLADREGQAVALPDGRANIDLPRITVRESWKPLRRLPNAQGPYRLGETITLAGYEAVAAGEGEPGVELKLWWRAETPLTADLTVFAQVFDANGEMVGQLDGAPCEGACPTSRWTPGGVIEDWRRIPLKPGTAPEGLTAVVGLYDLATGERLPPVDAEGNEMPERAIRIGVASPAGGNATP